MPKWGGSITRPLKQPILQKHVKNNSTPYDDSDVPRVQSLKKLGANLSNTATDMKRLGGMKSWKMRLDGPDGVVWVNDTPYKKDISTNPRSALKVESEIKMCQCFDTNRVAYSSTGWMEMDPLGRWSAEADAKMSDYLSSGTMDENWTYVSWLWCYKRDATRTTNDYMAHWAIIYLDSDYNYINMPRQGFCDFSSRKIQGFGRWTLNFDARTIVSPSCTGFYTPPNNKEYVVNTYIYDLSHPMKYYESDGPYQYPYSALDCSGIQMCIGHQASLGEIINYTP